MNKRMQKTAKKTAFGLAIILTTVSIGGIVSAGSGDTNFAASGVSAVMESYVDRMEESQEAHVNIAGVSALFDSYYQMQEESVGDVASKEEIEVILKLRPSEEKDQKEKDQNKKEEQKKDQDKKAEQKKEQDKKTEQKKKEEKKQEEDAPVSFAGYQNLGVANVTNYLNVREEPGMDGKIIGTLPMNAGCEITATLDGWYQITSGEVTGYVSAEYLLTGKAALKRAKESMQTVATVACDQLMVREEPNTNCAIMTRVSQGENLEVVKVLDGWVQIDLNGNIAYVCADYVDVHESLPVAVTITELTYGSTVSNAAVDVVEFAKQFLGNPYVLGGTSLTNGADCSGFTMSVFAQFGYSLPRIPVEQSYCGTQVSLSEIQPGDLLFYSYGGSIGHVAIYAGGGMIIHAANENAGITIGNAYYQTPACAVRVIQ